MRGSAPRRGRLKGALCLTPRSDPSLSERGRQSVAASCSRARRRRDRGVGQRPTILGFQRGTLWFADVYTSMACLCFSGDLVAFDKSGPMSPFCHLFISALSPPDHMYHHFVASSSSLRLHFVTKAGSNLGFCSFVSMRRILSELLQFAFDLST